MFENIAIIGVSGAIGNSLLKQAKKCYDNRKIQKSISSTITNNITHATPTIEFAYDHN